MTKLWRSHETDVTGASGMDAAGLARLSLLAAAMLGMATLCLRVLDTELETVSLSHRSIDLEEGEALLASRAPPSMMLAGATALDRASKPALSLAEDLTRSSLRRQPQQPFAWAQLADVRTRLKGNPDPVALEALQHSIGLCRYCNRELLRWRLTFALNHWDSIPESLRLEIFEGAEFLRWWHLDGAFLAEARETAEARNIPFADYQQKVLTNLRPYEVEAWQPEQG